MAAATPNDTSKLRAKLGSDVVISKANIVFAIGQAMKQAELFLDMSGMQKRQLVLDTLKTMIQENKSLTEADKAGLVEQLMYWAPPMIDLVVNPASLGLNLVRTACCSGMKRKN